MYDKGYRRKPGIWRQCKARGLDKGKGYGDNVRQGIQRQCKARGTEIVYDKGYRQRQGLRRQFKARDTKTRVTETI